MIGLTRIVFAVGAGAACGLGTQVAARRFVTSAPPPLAIMLVLQIAVGLSAALLAPARLFPASLVLGFPLALLAVIDAGALRLPDAITLPLGVAGLIAAALLEPTSLAEHAIGAVVGYGAFALLAVLHRRARGREGLGLGDAKLLACAGAWLGWRPLPLVVLAAALGGIAWLVAARLRRGASAWREPVPFGVPLALSIWGAWLVATAGTRL